MPFPTSVCAQNGKYTDIRPIGRGAYGQVYFAKDNLGREVAVKEALPSNLEFEYYRGKFQKESRIQASLRHPNILHVYSLEDDPETRELYLVSEYANGGSLAEHLEKHGPLGEREAIKVALDICAALEATSVKRIVHRDVKPSNIMLVRDAQGAITEAKLGDFGIAQDRKARATTVMPGMGHPGTPSYMPPEQFNAANVLDVRADIFALGITLWETLTGEDYKLLAQEGTPDLGDYNPRASAGIAKIIRRAVEEDRAQRYKTPQDLANELQAVLAGNRPQPYTQATLGARPVAQAPGKADRRPLSRRHMRWGCAGTLLVLIFAIGAQVAGLQTFLGLGPQVNISVAYSSNLQDWFDARLAAFHATRPQVNGRRISVEGIPKASGALQTELRQGTLQPTVWVPSSSIWLEVLKQEKADPNLAVSQGSLFRTPVTIAIWRPMAETLGWPGKALGWSDVLGLIGDEQGWGKYNHPEWGRFSWGHTDPAASTTALSTVLAEFYAATNKTKGLSVADVQAPASQQFLRRLAEGIKHYGYTSSVFTDNMKKYGMSYISAVPMEEHQIVEFNKGAPVTPLVAIYPREGTFWHNNPYIVMTTATPEQQQAADQLYTFLLTPESQTAAMQFGYRPANPDVPLSAPIAPQFGVDPTQPETLLEVPPANVIAAARNAWAANRKRANIVLVVDTSGSMKGDKIQEAKAGLELFLSRLLPDDRVALVTFSDNPSTAVPLGTLSESREQLHSAILSIQAVGGTALYDGLLHGRQVLEPVLNESNRINAIVLLSDGLDTASTKTLADIQRELGEGGLPIFPIAYGSDADKDTLQSIADLARTLLIEGDAGDINKVFESMSQYF